ncbi:inner membrane translocase subunit [Rhodotorula toruloides ATCC 204091]|uniref:Mitochondrial import inner membrane translocase subunit TIM54 n=1 Tax=Rhodotorula toruloides TaxID=5286 RepID=A0A0K3CEP4_RHOTO|nr:inner membrane translocase subunit [Rhodotorula toruloides ATCC 204091]KAK4332660.1 Mitochondrial import inner membrane translocase subunit TIM54 [Rhodotorula toruloides]PRQ74015.1 inner membrane translocase subunit [Rhodotorula toruloides]
MDEQQPQPPHQPAAAPTPVPGPSTRKLPPKPVKPTNPFVYLGIPQFVFDWRPSMPGPKMSVFLAVSSALTGLYVYDRRECKRIQQEYIDKVKWMSEQPLEADQRARKVKVYGARVPDDGELERGAKWFKRYMKPILVASGTDYALKVGTNPGGLGRTLAHEIRARRITEAAQEPVNSAILFTNSPEANVNAVLADRDLEEMKLEEKNGAIVLLGRGALKEYLWALKKGYGEEIDLRQEAKLEGLGLGANERRKDGRWEREEELMLRELEKEDDAKPDGGPFDEKAAPSGLESVGDEPASSPLPSQPVSFLTYSPYRQVPTSPAPASASPTEPEPPLVLPPTDVPPQPPLLLVPFSYPFGIRTWASKIAHFWNHRTDVRLGGEMSLALILSQIRPFDPPKNCDPESGSLQGLLDEDFVARIRRGELHESKMADGVPTGSKDLDFLFETDEEPRHFKKAYQTLPKNHEYLRRTYYNDELPPRLRTARELARGEREPTKAEINYPPRIESELRKERLDKELRWRRELEGWAMQRSGSGVAWKDGWEKEGLFNVIERPNEVALRELEEQKRMWEETKKAKEEERERRWAEDLKVTENDDE